MKLIATHLHATFSGITSCWAVELDDILFKVRYIKIDDVTDQRLGSTVAELWAKNVEITWRNDVLSLSNWDVLEKIERKQILYDPDQPRNLAKSVTVK